MLGCRRHCAHRLEIEIDADREARHEEMAHDVAMAEAGGRSVTMSRNQGQDSEREEGQEMSAGGSSERSEQDQPRPEGDA